MGWEESGRETGQGEVKVVACCFVEDGLGEIGGVIDGGCGDSPEDDVERGGEGWDDEGGVGGEALVELKRGFAAEFEVASKLAVADIWQQLLGGPKSNGRRSGAGALEGDLAKVKIFGGEVSVGRVVFIKAAYGGITKEDAAAAVRLEAVLVGVDDDGVSVEDGIEGGATGRVEVGDEGKVTAVRGVDVDAEFVTGLELY